jgi:hypothetical protein
MTADIYQQKQIQGLLLSPKFDQLFIGGIFLLAVAAGLIGLTSETALQFLIVANIWVLGYHHVISTYTRLCFDKKNFERSKFLIIGLGPVVLLSVIGLSWYFGVWILVTIYLYAQWFHYSRQSWGISRAYERAGGKPGHDRGYLTQAAFYLFPVWGILNRSYQDPGKFLDVELKVIPTPGALVTVVGAIALCLFAIWAARTMIKCYRGEMSKPYAFFMLSHFAIFFVAYIVMPEINSGWLVIGVWHNLQYIMFVWLFNNKQYKSGVAPDAKFLSFLSQTKNWPLYILFCAFVSTIVYQLLSMGAGAIFSMASLIVVYQTINFHHYIVDATIWRANWIKRGRVQSVAKS